MINDFIVKAFPEKNLLKISMDGYFQRSELELALHLAKSESRKLHPGFAVSLNIRNLRTSMNVIGVNFSKFRRLLMILGASNFHFIGVNHASSKALNEDVGFYPEENEWFLR
jgi:hypothetical protein